MAALGNVTTKFNFSTAERM